MKHADKAAEAGCDAVVAEGFEAGGHNGVDEITTLALVPQVVDAVALPVIAAGGIADGRGLAAALALGAEGVQVGTRFAATVESSAHENYKKASFEAGDTGTVLTMKKITPVRMVKTPFTKRSEAERDGATGRDARRCWGRSGREGDLRREPGRGKFEAGQSSGLVREILPPRGGTKNDGRVSRSEAAAAVSRSFLDVLKEKIIVFDGATGTHLQGQDLTADDFGGEHLNGCNEYLVVSRPSAVENVHRDYLEAGCDVIETDSFGSTSIVLAEYGLADRAYELNVKAAQIARRDGAGNSPRPTVPGSWPARWDRPRSSRRSAISASRTWPGRLQRPGAGAGRRRSGSALRRNVPGPSPGQGRPLPGSSSSSRSARRRVPVIVSVTVETTGTLLLGTEISAALASLEPFDVDVIGMNCATGPKEMSEHVRALCLPPARSRSS